MREAFERLLVGRTLAGRYELGEAIGSGGMSVVYRGVDRVLGRPVAVKVISLPAENDQARENLRERFRREAASAARIAHHPNVVQVYDYGTDEALGLDFIVMELLRGRDLKQALALASLPRAEALRVLRETARGLAAGHREGIVHRDVKPANVFLAGQEGRLDYVRILDFGIAKPLRTDDDELTLTGLGQLPHSPAYASPEQLDPDAAVTPASDVYQLGLIGYELLTGERAYSEGERVRIRAGEEVPLVDTPRWRAVSAPLREVIARALRRDPAARYPDAAAFADALADAEEAASHAPVDDPRGHAPEDDDRTMLADAAPPPSIPLAEPTALGFAAVPPAVEPVSDEPYQQPVAARLPRRVSRLVWIAPLLLLAAALAVWASRRPATAPGPLARTDTGEVAALDRKFLRLEGDASEATEMDSVLREIRAKRDSGSATGLSTLDDSEAAQGVSNAHDATAIQNAVLDLHAAWSAGDLDRMMGHYAERVDYYGAEGVSRSFIRRDRAKSIERYGVRKITIRRQASIFLRPDLSRVLVDKDWDFEGHGERWTGSMRQEIVFQKIDGDWKIVSEKTNQVYAENRERM
jgi:serine/threonine protein kinase/ketosteroid isomerase-like protein